MERSVPYPCGTLLLFLFAAVAACDRVVAPADCAISISGRTFWPCPQEIPGDHQFEILTAGHSHTCGLDMEGKAWCWGRNDDGQLGPNAPTIVTTPIPAAPDLLFTALSVADGTTCGLSQQRVYCWGSWPGPEDIDPANPIQPFPGSLQTIDHAAYGAPGSKYGRFLCGVGPDFRAYCAGTNLLGELGRGDTISWGATLEPVVGLTGIRQVVTGALFGCALLDSGDVWCWGGSTSQTAGGPDTSPDTCTWGSAARTVNMLCSRSPMRLPSTDPFTFLSAGSSTSACGVQAGELVCWGFRFIEDGGLAFDPIRIDEPSLDGLSVTSAAVNWAGGCLLTGSGEAYCWGENAVGQLGAGHASPVDGLAKVEGGIPFRSLTAGVYRNCGVAVDDRGYCWGDLQYHYRVFW